MGGDGMPVSQNYIDDVDLDNETNPELIAAKINSEINQSRTYWQAFKELCTDLYFDFLSWKEGVDNANRSNTFIPLSYVDIQVTKARIKRTTTSTRPYGRIRPVPFNADLSFRLSEGAHQLLQEAEFDSFWDLLIQDALIYPGAPFQVTWGIETALMPVLDPLTQLPVFDEMGKRVFAEQPVRNGLFLENIGIQDFYLPQNSKKVETDPWAAKMYNVDLQTLRGSFKSDGSPKYINLEQLGIYDETKRPDSSEQERMAQPTLRDTSTKPTYGKTWDIIEFVTRNKIFHVPYGTNFLISDPEEHNPYHRKPFHIARVEKLTNEPYGFCPNRANHLMTRTYNEMWDVVMDGLFKEDNKAFIYNDELINAMDIGGEQGNLIGVHGLDPGVDVTTAIKALETRALATELFPVLGMINQIHEQTASRSATDAGLAQQGAETAYENARIEAGAAHRPLDMAQNIVDTALRPIYLDLIHLARLNFIEGRQMEKIDDNGQVSQSFALMPSDFQGMLHVDFDFIDKERKRLAEQAQTMNLLQVWGNMANIDPVSVVLMKNLLLNSGLPDTVAIQKALDQSLMQRQMLQVLQMQMQMQAQQAQAIAQQNRFNQSEKKPRKDTAGEQATHRAGNSINAMKPAGVG